MDYNKVGIWIKGYLDAIQSGEEVTKAQLDLLISRIKELISEVEKNNTAPIRENEDIEDDDLPF